MGEMIFLQWVYGYSVRSGVAYLVFSLQKTLKFFFTLEMRAKLNDDVGTE